MYYIFYCIFSTYRTDSAIEMNAQDIWPQVWLTKEVKVFRWLVTLVYVVSRYCWCWISSEQQFHLKKLKVFHKKLNYNPNIYNHFIFYNRVDEVTLRSWHISALITVQWLRRSFWWVLELPGQQDGRKYWFNFGRKLIFRVASSISASCFLVHSGREGWGRYPTGGRYFELRWPNANDFHCSHGGRRNVENQVYSANQIFFFTSLRNSKVIFSFITDGNSRFLFNGTENANFKVIDNYFGIESDCDLYHVSTRVRPVQGDEVTVEHRINCVRLKEIQPVYKIVECGNLTPKQTAFRGCSDWSELIHRSLIYQHWYTL